MQSGDTITTLFRHNQWANERILEQCSTLSDEQLDSTLSGTFGSIRDTLQHIVISEQSYFSRISTGQPLRRPEHAAPLTMAEMLASVRTTGAGFIEWAPRVQASDTVQINWDGSLLDVQKTIILTQVINHATEHRAQIMAILTQLGIEPPDVSGWSFFETLMDAE